MYFSEIFRVLSRYLFAFSLLLTLPLLLAVKGELIDYQSINNTSCSFAFLMTILVCWLLAFLFKRGAGHSKGQLFRREGIALAALIWGLTPLIGSLPFIFSGTLSSPVDAFFESTSGFTTTGASNLHAKLFDEDKPHVEIPYNKASRILPGYTYSFYGNIDPVRDPINQEIIKEGIEALPESLLFWRSFSQWLGGMGIVVLFVALLPMMGVGGKVLFQSEVTGPSKEALTPRTKETASILWKIYLGLSVFQTSLLMWVNKELPFFDALTLTFSTVSTGGFTIWNSGIAHYAHQGMESVILVFMALGAVNFSLFYYLIIGKLFRLFDAELMVYLSTLAVGTGLIAWQLWGNPIPMLGHNIEKASLGQSLHVAAFHYISSQTSSGFSTSNYDLWPFASQVCLLMAMYIGGMSGSTGGGVKVIRHYLIASYGWFKLRSLIRPQEVRVFRLHGSEIDPKICSFVLVYFFAAIFFSGLGILFFVFDGIEPESALTLTACMINNVGFSFRMAGPTESFAFLSPLAKMVCCFLMILGRLEFFTLLVVLMPSFWRGD